MAKTYMEIFDDLINEPDSLIGDPTTPAKVAWAALTEAERLAVLNELHAAGVNTAYRAQMARTR
jgi:hypothetical protein